MRIVYMGTPSYAAIILEALAAQHDVVAVFTNEDKVRSRGNKTEATAVKVLARQLDLPVYTPKTLRDAEVQAQLAELAPDIICVAAYGKILPQAVLDIPRLGCVNVHASILPRWRGAAPIQRAILAGDARQGVSIMQMEAGLDTGAYCYVAEVDPAGKSAAQLTEELAAKGAQALLEALSELEAGTITWQPQNVAEVTYAEKITRQDLYLSPEESAELGLRKVLASDFEHPAKAVIGSRIIAIIEAGAADVDVPSGVAKLLAGKLYVGCNQGALELLQVKPDGKNLMTGKAFAAGVQGIKQGVSWTAVTDGMA